MKSARYFDHMGVSSPSDVLVRHGRRERAAQFGLSVDEHEESFELNQSFPRLSSKPTNGTSTNHHHHHHHLTPDINRLRGNELASINFVPLTIGVNNLAKKAAHLLLNDTVYSHSPHPAANESSSSNNRSWLFYNQFVNTRALLTTSPDLQMISNPNKAVCVINGRTSEILTANDVACELFGVTGLAGRKLKDMLVVEEGAEQAGEMLMESDRLDENGRAVLCAGKIFDALVESSTPTRLPVSVYIVKLTDETDPRCLCVMEPIQRVLGHFALNVKGRIRHYNTNFSYIFGYTSAPIDCQQVNSPRPLASLSALTILNGKDIADLIPNMRLPISSIQEDVRHQALTGRTCTGENIPISVSILNKKLFNNEGIV